MHVAGCMVFEGKAPSYPELVDQIGLRLHLVPRYRQRLAFVPFNQGRPVWVDDPHFNLTYHVRHTALPRPGAEGDLKRLAGRIFSQALDRNRPLWELWLVEGLDGGRFALLSKTHHALVDGVSGVDIATVLFDSSPNPMPVSQPESEWIPRPLPTKAQLLADAVVERGTVPGRSGARRARDAARTSGRGQAGRRGARGRRSDGLDGTPGGAAEPVQRADRAAPPVHLGSGRSRRVQGDQELARRHRQRRGSGGRRGRARSLSAPQRPPDRRPRAQGDGPGVGPRRRRARCARQQGRRHVGARSRSG